MAKRAKNQVREALNAVINIAVTPAEKRRIEEVAAMQERTLSAMCRRLLRQGIEAELKQATA